MPINLVSKEIRKITIKLYGTIGCKRFSAQEQLGVCVIVNVESIVSIIWSRAAISCASNNT